MPRHFPVALILCVLGLRPAGAQSALDRTPNLDGGWVGVSGMLHFNFVHRFSASSAPERKVTSAPTFLIAGGLPHRILLGAHYATNSQLSPRYPNEWELFGRFAALDQTSGAPLDLTAQAGYNFAAEGLDGQLSLGRRQGKLRVLAAVRLLAEPDTVSGTDVAVATGLVLRLGRYISLSGDIATLTDRATGEDVAWGAGINLGIPRTPHTLSLHASNVNNITLQSASRGSGETRYGFEFTIPLTLSRYFGGGDARPPAQAAGGDTVAAGTATRAARMIDFAFQPARIEVAAGTTVTWTNGGQVVHTVTADDRSFDTGNIDTGGTGRLTFTRPGTYAYHCTPHPFMKGVVVVK
jgi:plastocyanin